MPKAVTIVMKDKCNNCEDDLLVGDLAIYKSGHFYCHNACLEEYEESQDCQYCGGTGLLHVAVEEFKDCPFCN